MKQYIMHVLGAVSQELYFPDAHLTDIIEILILTYLIYHIAMWLINTKAWMLMRGIVVLVSLYCLQQFLRCIQFYSWQGIR